MGLDICMYFQILSRLLFGLNGCHTLAKTLVQPTTYPFNAVRNRTRDELVVYGHPCDLNTSFPQRVGSIHAHGKRMLCYVMRSLVLVCLREEVFEIRKSQTQEEAKKYDGSRNTLVEYGRSPWFVSDDLRVT